MVCSGGGDGGSSGTGLDNGDVLEAGAKSGGGRGGGTEACGDGMETARSSISHGLVPKQSPNLPI